MNDYLQGGLMASAAFIGIIFIGITGNHVLDYCCPENNIAIDFWQYVPNYLLILLVGIVVIKNQRSIQTSQKQEKVAE